MSGVEAFRGVFWCLVIYAIICVVICMVFRFT